MCIRDSNIHIYIYNLHVWLVFRMGDWKLIQGSAGRWNDWYPVPGEQGDETPVPEEQGLGPDDYQLFNIKGRLALAFVSSICLAD